ncbi:MAG: hypothetical protein NC308_07370 [Clostridium sp.]|nr:hypothetical protein [Bacteroides sp.]MCM1198692.1 hypothetical protein [Clostridium sp.]
MKSKLLIIGLLLSASLFGQVKKVAILETVDKKGDLDYAVKLMLRSNLAKAITNTAGYEAYDRTDVDAIMGEQDFQRTGMVSDDQIKRLGEMTGADYILVAEAVVAGESNMFITAKILNVESARTEKTDNALMGLSPVDIQRGCEELAGNLFGVKITSSVKTSNSTKTRVESTSNPDDRSTEETSGSKSGNFFNRVFSSGNSSENSLPPAATSVRTDGTIGSLIYFDDGTAGIIFYLNPYGEGGLAVSLDETVLEWDNSKKKLDISGLLNEKDKCSLMCNPGMGSLNTDRILAQVSGAAPAAAWCRGHGNGWYLPSAGEFLQLVMANKYKGKNGPINSAIVVAGGEPFQQRYYWVSNEKDKKEAYNFPVSGKSADTEKKGSAEGVRAIRMF